MITPTISLETQLFVCSHHQIIPVLNRQYLYSLLTNIIRLTLLCPLEEPCSSSSARLRKGRTSMNRTTRLALMATLLGSAALVPATAFAATPTCSQLATDPANGLAGNPIILSPTSTLVPAAGGNAAYCRVDFTLSSHGGPAFGYAVGQNQMVKLRVGLPLNGADGGTGGVQGAWNGKTRNIGGGGCVGTVGSVTTATNTRYVGSSTDGGHTDTDCSFALKPDPNKLNIGTIRDNFYDSIL